MHICPWLETDAKVVGQVLTFYTSPDGSKKAYARLTPDVDALDIAATKLALV